MISTAKRIQGSKPYYFATKLAEIRSMMADGIDVINLGIGSPDLLPPPDVVVALQHGVASEGAHGYQPYRGIRPLRKAMTNWYKRWYATELDAEREVLPLLGSKEGLMHISMAFVETGDKVLVPDPGYPAYRAVTEIAGGTVVPYKLSSENGYLPKLDSLDTDCKVMYLGYPHMPTGATASLEDLQRIVDWATEYNVLLVNDNPYSHILQDPPVSILQTKGSRRVCLELTSLSKNFNMAGWRVGCLAGNATLIDQVLTFKSNMDSGMFKPVQEAAIAALLTPDAWLQKQNQTYRDRQKIAYAIMEVLGCTYDLNTAGLFVWGRLPNNQDSRLVSDDILNNCGVFLTPGFIFGSMGESHLRLSLCSPVDRLEAAYLRIKNVKA